MFDGDSTRALRSLGFRPVGVLSYRTAFEVWWHDDERTQLVVLRCGRGAIVRGSKHYFVRAVSPEGETWARDVGQLHDYLENHFPEMRLSFSHFRSISGRLAQQHIRQRSAAKEPAARVPDAAELGRLARRAEASRTEHQSRTTLSSLTSGDSGLLKEYLRMAQLEGEQRLEQQERELEKGHRASQVFQELQRKYVRDGSAASLVFNICSSAHVATNDREFADAVTAVVKEMHDADRFEVSQKLGQGRLSIQVVAAEDPSWTWVEEWLGGSLSPRQLERLSDEFARIRDSAESVLMVTPDQDIVVDGQVKEEQKLLGARVLGSCLRRVDQPRDREVESRAVEPRHLPVSVGQLVSGGRPTGPCLLPLAKLEHVAVSGSTGAGKSVFVRVLVEEAALKKVSVLVLDPRNQGAGLLVPEDRPELLGLYPEFRLPLDGARAFPFSYFGPGESLGLPIPSELASLGTGLNIVSFKGLAEADRCSLFARILDGVFLARSEEQTDSLRLLVVVEEAQLFTKRRVGPEARIDGARAETALDRIIREGRKYGLCVVVASQSIKDFSHDVASIRQNTNTKVFFRNADREVGYAADFLGDGKRIISLPPGMCIVHNAELGVLTVRVRPPLSKLWEFSAADTKNLLQPATRVAVLSPDAQHMLATVREHYAMHGTGLNLSELANQSGITSKRRLQELVDELEGCGVVRTKKLRMRGQPRIIEPVRSSAGAQGVDGTRTEAGPNAQGASAPETPCDRKGGGPEG